MSMGFSRREFLAGLAGTGLALACAGKALGEDKGKRPNFVLCMTDDQGWGDVSYNGLKNIKTANLDAMAGNGLRLNRFYAAPVCSPCRGNVMTGRHYSRYGCDRPGSPLRIEEMTIAQALHGAGYVTGHFGKWHLNGITGPGKPISADDPLSPGKFGFDEWLSVSNYFNRDWTFSRNGKAEEKLAGDGSEGIMAEALKFIDQSVAKKKPFLAVVWFGSPHAPHDPLPEDAKAGGPYYGELLGVDRAMGALRAGLRKRGLADDTLVWFNSDNGPAAGSAGGLRGKKDTIWEGGVRVPGLIEWPSKIKKPAVSDVPACVSDIYPTLVELGQAKVANQILPLDGISLVPLFDGKMAERPTPIGFRNGKDAALAGNRYKLHKLGADKYELYDLTADAAESKDLADTKPDVVKEMKAQLDTWQKSVERSLKKADYAGKK